jgi:methionyl-tRNA formyltransferase
VSKVRLCFLGTPEIAATCLRGVHADEHYEVVGVITQPDRPAGRKLQLTPTPVKILALSFGVPILSPESVNTDEILAVVQSWRAEVAVVVAFGQIVSQKFLDLFPHGCVNVHASLLPLWRGAAPIQRSIQAGDKVTGVCLQKMVKKLDAGDVLGVRELKIDEDITALEMQEKMALLGTDLLKIELMDYIRGNLMPTPQDESRVTYAKKIDKAESEISWHQTAQKIHDTVRAFTMGPGTWTLFREKKIKIIKTKYPTEIHLANELDPGTWRVQKDQLFVKAKDAWLQILEVQPESRSRQSVVEFLRGQSLTGSEKFGS